MTDDGVKQFLLRDYSRDQAYKLLTGAVQPRPIAWVSTRSSDGVSNLAPFSFFNVASPKPPTVMFSVSRRADGADDPKDTLANIRETKEFVVNIPAAANADAVTVSNRAVPPSVNEFALAGVTEVASQTVSAPSVAEALFSLECVLAQEVALGENSVVFGTVLSITSRQNVIEENLRVNYANAAWLGRRGGPYYATEMNVVDQEPHI